MAFIRQAAIGFDPTIRRGELTADRSTAELLRIMEEWGSASKSANRYLVKEVAATSSVCPRYVSSVERLTRTYVKKLAIGFDPTIRRGELTADRSTAELLRITEGGGRLAKAQTALLSRERSCALTRVFLWYRFATAASTT